MLTTTFIYGPLFTIYGLVNDKFLNVFFNQRRHWPAWSHVCVTAGDAFR